MDRLRAGGLLLAVYAWALWRSHGECQPGPILLSFTAFLFSSALFLADVPRRTGPVGLERILAGLFAWSFLLTLSHPRLQDFTDTMAALAMRGSLLVGLVGFVLIWAPRTQTLGYWLALGALGHAHLLVVLVSPTPGIDIWLFYQKASGHFWAGENPYAQTDYPEIYGGRYGYPPGLHYLPASVYVLAPFQRIFGDVRVGLWAAGVGSALLLGALAAVTRQRAVRSEATVGVPLRTARLATLTWLIFPSTFPVLERCWIDSLMAFWALLGLVLALKGRLRLASLAWGIALATKQTVLVPLLAVTAFLVGQRTSWRREWWSALAITLGTAAALMAPYALWDWHAFWPSITQVFRNPPRMDSFSLVALASHLHGLTIETWQTLIIYAVCIPPLLWRLLGARTAGEVLEGTAVLLGLTFYFGKQAFLNYYDLLALVLLACLLMGLAEQREAVD